METRSLTADLRTSSPRRWSESVDGVLWLPRFVDKARAYDAGTLGLYLFGQSPLDDSFLREARLDYVGFLEIVRSAPDDSAVLDAIEARSPGARERLRRWSVRIPTKAEWILTILDYDDGYALPPLMSVLVPVVRTGANLVSRAARLVRPARTTPRASPP